MALQEFSELELQNIGPDEKNPPKKRIKDSRSARSLYENLKKADERSSANRQRVQAMFDGTPPYSDSQLRQQGQGFRTNINFGEGENYLEEAMSAYVDLVHSTDNLVHIETIHGEAKERKEWSRIMSEEYSHILKGWEGFNYEYLHLCHHFVGHGVGVNYFESTKGWKWKSSGLGDFLVPRETRASADCVELACAERSYTIPELYSKIEDPEAAKKLGWNVEATIRAIRNAASNYADWGDSVDWEKLQAEIKNNDLFLGAKTAKIKVAHMWVREFDGKISHMIVLLQHETEKDQFLMYQQGKYNHIGEAFTFFTYGIGTNGTFHGVRGLGFKIFSQIQLNNRIRSQAVDNAMLAGSPLLQPTDEHALEDLAFNFFGPFGILPPGVEVVDRALPNVSNTMMPVLEDLGRLTQRRTGQYTAQSAFGGDSRKTRFEVAAQLEQNSKLSATSQNLFYGPWEKFHIELARRFHDPDYSESYDGWDEVNEFRLRCMNRGVPPEALGAVDYSRTKAVRAIGNGSQSTRIVQLQQLNELAGTFDEEGRHNLFRDQAAAIVGQESADRYIPSRPDSRTTQDHRIALLETNDLLTGKEFEPFPDDLHLIHLEIHVPKMEEFYQAVEAGQKELVQFYLESVQLFQHCVKHLEYMQTDVTIQHRVNEFNERLQQISELIINGQKAHEKLMQEQAQAQAEQQGPEGQAQQGPSPEEAKIQAKLIEAQAKLQMMKEKHDQELMMKLQKHQQDLALADAKAAASLKDLLK